MNSARYKITVIFKNYYIYLSNSYYTYQINIIFLIKKEANAFYARLEENVLDPW